MKLALLLGTAAVTTSSTSAVRVYRLSGVDIIGKDISQAGPIKSIECLGYCLSQPSCSASTWTDYNGGTCWAKAAGFKGTPSAPKAEADSHILLDDSTSSYIWSATKDGYDMAGYDIDNKPGGGMPKCMELCNANRDCYAVTWTNYQGGTCWLKSRASGYLPKAGAKAAYVAREGP